MGANVGSLGSECRWIAGSNEDGGGGGEGPAIAD
jgi:hypothetical protein